MILMMRHLIGTIAISVSIWLLASPTTLAQEAPICEIDVIVQRDDWLSKLSEKFYGDVLAFPAIAWATNARAAVDVSYTTVEDEDFIEIGWKLCIVDIRTAEDILGFTLGNAPLADDAPANLNGVINVGAAHDLSGPYANVGRSIRKGIDLAVNQINETVFLGGGSLQIIWEDTSGDKNQAVNAFNRLINEDQVVAILGPTLSRSAFVALPSAQQAGVPTIGSSNAASGIGNLGSSVFRTNLAEGEIIRNTVRRANEVLNLERVALIYDRRNVFTNSGRGLFEQALSDEGIEVIGTIPFGPEEAVFADRLAELKSLQPDAIILSVLAEDASRIIAEARQLGISANVRFIGGSSLDSPAFFAQGNEVVNGTISGAAWNVNDISGSNRKFVADYQAEYGDRPNIFAAQAYTALWALATALRNADSTDRVAIRDGLDTLDLIESPLGLFTFNENRGPNHSPVLQVVENGEFVIFQ
jgi:branched-chain amino acid transport system substrate-binding protein